MMENLAPECDYSEAGRSEAGLGDERARGVKDRFARYALIWVLLLATIWLGDRFVRSMLLTADQPRAITARGDLAENERHRVALFEAVAPSVVYLFTEGPARAGGERRAGAGSGFVWDTAGHVVTNHHVIEGATRVRVRLDSGAAIDARVVGSAPDQDLAVVKLAETREILHAIPIGRSVDLKVGQSVFAIGNPFGLNRSLTAGIISALDRRLPTASNREIAGVIQVDAAINPGNSGGPLLDSAGRLIGVTTAILSETGSFAGVGFAVPVDVVNRIVPGLIRDGRVPRPGIGIMAAPEEATARMGVSGVVVAQVQPGSSAAQAGLQGINRASGALGDVITHVEGKPVRTIAELASQLDRVGVGKSAQLTVQRDGRSRTVAVGVVDIAP
jgi:2-alkenal reductase